MKKVFNRFVENCKSGQFLAECLCWIFFLLGACFAICVNSF